MQLNRISTYDVSKTDKRKVSLIWLQHRRTRYRWCEYIREA